MAEIILDDEQPKSTPLTPEQQASIDRNAPAPDTLLNKAGRILGYANRNPLVSDAAKLSLVTPGAGTALGQIGMAAGTQGVGALARGEGVGQAAKDAAMGGVGTAATQAGIKGAKMVAGAGPLQAFAKRAEEQLANMLRERVPAWKGMGSLREMLYDQAGHDALHTAYDQSLKDVIAKGAGKTVPVPNEVAEALGVAGVGGGMSAKDLATIGKQLGMRRGENVASILGQGTPSRTMDVDAAELAKAMTGKSGTSPYRAAAAALDAAGIGDPQARDAYKTAMGLKDFIARTGGMPTGEFDVMKAQRGLGTPASGELLDRGLQADVKGILNPGGGPFIEQGTQAIPGSLIGAALGGTIGLPTAGHAGMGGGMGLGSYVGGKIGSKIPRYSNIPEGPLQPKQDEIMRMILRGMGLAVTTT